MSLPATLQEEIESKLGAVQAVASVGGGSISSACRIDAADGSLFAKFESRAPPGFFAVEAAGLEQLRQTECGVRIPRVVTFRDDPQGTSWIVMEWLARASERPDLATTLGTCLARLHRTGGECWGWDRDGYIGRLPQSNRPRGRWAEFWWSERLLPQLVRARSEGYFTEPEWDALRDTLPARLAPAEEEGPSLLHGDLWSGNVVATPDGPGLVDPSCYYGHREVDLAMTELFGGFGPAFYAAYQSSWPTPAGYPVRRGIYQLYYLLVHVNLFGASYVGRTKATLRAVLAT